MLKVVNLQKSYVTKTKERWQALKGVSLEFPNKGFIFIVGKSGSGKSTLLNIIGGLDSYDSGEIIIRGKSSATFKAADFDSYRNTYIGFVFQEFNLLEEYSLAKNVQLALELQSFKGDMNARVDEILDQVELKDKKNNKINEISGGQKQRVAIARALVKNPEIIIADEPTGNLDSETGRSVMDTLKKLSKEKLVIMVTHDIDYAAEYADRVIELKDGVVIKDETKSTSSSSVAVQYFDKPSSDVEKVIYIPKNKKVDNSFVEKINSLIAANPSEDLYIAISSKDKVIEQIAPKISSKIEKAGEGTVVALDYSPVDDFKLVKSKLPFIDSFKMAFKSIFIKKVRLFFTILLMTLSFIFFGQSETIRSANFGDAAVTSLNAAGIDNVIVDYQSYSSDSVITQLNYFDHLKSKFPGIEIHKVYGGAMNYNFDSAIKFPSDTNTSLKPAEYPTLHYKDIDYSGISLTTIPYDRHGEKTLLEKDDTLLALKNSVYISNFLADIFMKNDLSLKSYKDLIGKEMYVGMPIAGIYKLRESKEFIQAKKLSSIYSTQNENSMDWNKLDNNPRDRMLLQTFSSSKKAYTSLHVKEDFEYEKNGIYYIKSDSVNTSNGSRYIDYSYMPQTYKNYISMHNGYNGSWGDDDIVVTSGVISALYPNFDKSTFDAPIESTDLTFKQGQSKVNIIGIVEENFSIKNSPTTVFINENSFNWFKNNPGNDGYLANLFENSWQHRASIKMRNGNEYVKLMKYLDDQNYYFLQDIIFEISSVTDILGVMDKVFFWASFVTLLFAIFLLFSGLSASVLNKKKEIGTLRAIGARGWDVAKIFIIEALIMTIFVAIIASICVFIISGLIDSIIIKEFYIFGMIKMKWFIPLELLGIAVFSSFISAFLPAKKVSMMKPIDAIKNK